MEGFTVARCLRARLLPLQPRPVLPNPFRRPSHWPFEDAGIHDLREDGPGGTELWCEEPASHAGGGTGSPIPPSSIYSSIAAGNRLRRNNSQGNQLVHVGDIQRSAGDDERLLDRIDVPLKRKISHAFARTGIERVHLAGGIFTQ